MTSPDAPTAPASTTAGWRLGLLYGPAIYGVSAAAVALPAAAQGLRTDAATAVWILAIHALGLGVGAAVAGRATDIWRPHSVISVGTALLVTGAALCAIASALAVVVVGRGLLAAGSGAMTATALALAAGTPAPARPGVLARLGTLMAMFSATAPLAGALALMASWRVALMLPALSVAALPACWTLIRSRPHQGGVEGLDWAGAFLLALAVGGLLLAVESATVEVARPSVLALVVITCAAGSLLVVHSKRHPTGFLPAAVVHDRVFWHCGLVGAGVYGGLFAAVYAVPNALARLGHSAGTVGVLLLPGAIVGAVLARLATAACGRMPPNKVLAAMAVLFSAAILLAAADRRPAILVGAAAVGFAAFAFAQMNLTATLSARIAADARGGAVGTLNLLFFLGGALGSMTCAVFWKPCGLPAAFAATAVFPAAAAIAAWHLSLAPTGEAQILKDEGRTGVSEEAVE
ncbi:MULTISPECIES: MFS transporter [unclassified Micromonospora]|uniref:MFS transporter n=1 Tax=unclassified Micromonospora TaxID=2617518 RepID=UPI003629003F